MKKKIVSMGELIRLFVFSAGLLGVLVFSASAEQGSAYLSWTAPTTDEGGGALTGLAGYNIYYDTTSHAGTCPTGYASTVDTLDLDEDYAFPIDEFLVGDTYYFQVTAYDDATPANESECSTNPGEVSKMVSYLGDINPVQDNMVSIADLSILGAAWGNTDCGPVNKADIDRNCVVGLSDLSILALDYGKSIVQ